MALDLTNPPGWDRPYGEPPRRAWLTGLGGAAAVAVTVAAVAVTVAVVGFPGKLPSLAGNMVSDVHSPPVPSEAAHHPSVTAAVAYDQRLGASLAAIQQRLAGIKAALDERALADKLLAEKELLKFIDMLLPLSRDARADVDAVIRVAEDIRFELKFAEQQHQATAEFFRARAAATKTDAMRSVNMQTAEWFDGLARDVPRRQRLTDEFLGDLARMREEVTDSARTLHDLRAAIQATTAGPDPVPLSVEGRTFNRQVERFLTVIKRYYESFVSKAYPPPPSLAGPTSETPAPKTEK